MKRTMKITAWVLTILLASLFLTAGAAKFLSPRIAQVLAQQGFPDWLRLTLGVVEISAALVLLVPRVSFYAAGFLCVLVASFLFLHVWRGEFLQAVMPALVLALVAITGYLRHPRAFFMARLRAAVDQVAEREIAAGRQRTALRKVGLLNDSAIFVP